MTLSSVGNEASTGSLQTQQCSLSPFLTHSQGGAIELSFLVFAPRSPPPFLFPFLILESVKKWFSENKSSSPMIRIMKHLEIFASKHKQPST